MFSIKSSAVRVQQFCCVQHSTPILSPMGVGHCLSQLTFLCFLLNSTTVRAQQSCCVHHPCPVLSTMGVGHCVSQLTFLCFLLNSATVRVQQSCCVHHTSPVLPPLDCSSSGRWSGFVIVDTVLHGPEHIRSNGQQPKKQVSCAPEREVHSLLCLFC